MTKAPSLRDLQIWMKWILTDPRGVASALREPMPENAEPLLRYVEPGERLLSTIEGASLDEIETRLDIYAEGYFARLLEALSADFPVSLRLVGEDSFMRLVAEYLKHHPSTTTNIGEVGFSFPEFSKAYAIVDEYPALPDLLALELAVINSFYSRTAPKKMDFSVLADISEEKWARASLILDPSVRLLMSSYRLDLLWNSAALEPLMTSIAEASSFLVYRNGSIQVKRLCAAEYAILHGSGEGKLLTDLLDGLRSEDLEGFDLIQAFSLWGASDVIQKICF